MRENSVIDYIDIYSYSSFWCRYSLLFLSIVCSKVICRQDETGGSMSCGSVEACYVQPCIICLIVVLHVLRDMRIGQEHNLQIILHQYTKYHI